jgi:hypothetical protein
VPKLLPRVEELSRQFDRAGWDGKGLLRITGGDAERAERAGVLVIPVGEQIQAAPPFTLTAGELDEALARLSG